MVFKYLDNLPAPYSTKFSYLDYCLKYFSLVEIITSDEFKVNDEMGVKNPLKELSILVKDICKQNNKDLKSINENPKINLLDSIYIADFSFDTVKDIKKPNQITIFEMNLYYTSMKCPKKTDLPCFNKKTYFNNLINRSGDGSSLLEDGLEQYTMTCILIYCSVEADINIDFKPYINSRMEIKGKKDCHYIIYCMDYNPDKNIDYSTIKIDVNESQPLALPPSSSDPYGNNSGTDGCSINCPVCGTVNILNETNTEYKCVFCESSLF